MNDDPNRFIPDLVLPNKTPAGQDLVSLVMTREDAHALALRLSATMGFSNPDLGSVEADMSHWHTIRCILTSLEMRLVNHPAPNRDVLGMRHRVRDQERAQRWSALYAAMADDLNLNAQPAEPQ